MSMQTLDMEETMQAAKRAALAVRALGGRAYYVGGFVRDRLSGRENLDLDIEIYGIEREALEKLLADFGQVSAKGCGYGIYTLTDYGIDLALPRTEKRTGPGHRDFQVSPDPFLSFKDAAVRRDFTVNAILEDVLTGEIVDPYGGRADLEKGLLRHIDEGRFIEDPLRVLRACQFASRFDFAIDEETIKLCSRMDLGVLTGERVREELLKALLKSRKPSVFFFCLEKMNQLSCWFPELSDLRGLVQDPAFHPEGDVWTHTMQVLDRAAKLRSLAEDAEGFMLAALTHDFGKAVTTEYIKGHYHAYQHEIKGLPLVEAFLDRLGIAGKTKQYVLNLTELHMKPNSMAEKKSGIKSMNRMFYEAESAFDLLLLAEADATGRGDACSVTEYDRDTKQYLLMAYERYKEYIDRPYVSGKDLIRAGAKPGPAFKEVLEYVTKLRLAGVDYDTQLKQAMGQYKKAVKKRDENV